MNVVKDRVYAENNYYTVSYGFHLVLFFFFMPTANLVQKWSRVNFFECNLQGLK